MTKISPKDIGLKSYKTQINKSGDKTEIRYQGNLIATNDNQLLKIDNCGWKTQTTKQRLNTILDYYNVPFQLAQRDGIWYIVENETKIKMQFWGTATFLGGKLCNL